MHKNNFRDRNDKIEIHNRVVVSFSLCLKPFFTSSVQSIPSYTTKLMKCAIHWLRKKNTIANRFLFYSCAIATVLFDALLNDIEETFPWSLSILITQSKISYKFLPVWIFKQLKRNRTLHHYPSFKIYPNLFYGRPHN